MFLWDSDPAPAWVHILERCPFLLLLLLLFSSFILRSLTHPLDHGEHSNGFIMATEQQTSSESKTDMHDTTLTVDADPSREVSRKRQSLSDLFTIVSSCYCSIITILQLLTKHHIVCQWLRLDQRWISEQPDVSISEPFTTKALILGTSKDHDQCPPQS